jgi:hypothetical protein
MSRHKIPSVRKKTTKSMIHCALLWNDGDIPHYPCHDSSVGIATGYGLDDRVSRVKFPAGARNFSLHHRVQNGSGAHPASYAMGSKGTFHISLYEAAFEALFALQRENPDVLHSSPRRFTFRSRPRIRGCIQKFPDWVDNEIYAYNNKHSLGRNTKRYGGKTH